MKEVLLLPENKVKYPFQALSLVDKVVGQKQLFLLSQIRGGGGGGLY